MPVSRRAGKPMIALYMRDRAKIDTLVASASIDPGWPVTLTIRANGGTMAFDYAAGGTQATLVGDFDAGFLSTRRAGGFIGTVIGPYAWTE